MKVFPVVIDSPNPWHGWAWVLDGQYTSIPFDQLWLICFSCPFSFFPSRRWRGARPGTRSTSPKRGVRRSWQEDGARFDFQNRRQQFLENSCNFCLHSNNESNISIEAKLKWHRVSQTSSPSLRVNISKVQGRFYLERWELGRPLPER